MEVTLVLDARAEVGEGPVWDGDEGVLWWTDIRGRVVHRYDPATGRDEVHDIGLRVGCFALRKGGGFVLAAEQGFWFWRPGTAPEHIVDVEPNPENRMNDGGCDRQGRFLAASMSTSDPRRADGGCWRLNPDLTVDQLDGGLTIGNGIAFSPAGDRFYLADTTPGMVWVRDYDPATGRTGPRRDFASLAALEGQPDGATVDAAGGYWLAAVGGGHLYRFTPEGRLDLSIPIPTRRPTRPMFGGAGLEDVYLTSIGVDADSPAGGLFRIRGHGHRGLPEPRFRGGA